MLTSASSWMTSFSISFVIKWNTLSCNAFSRHRSSCSIISAVEGDRDGNCDSDRNVTDQTSFKSDETSFDLNSPFNIVSWIRSNWTGSDNNGISERLWQFRHMLHIYDMFLVGIHSNGNPYYTFYRGRPLMIAIIFMIRTKYHCNDSYYGD